MLRCEKRETEALKAVVQNSGSATTKVQSHVDPDFVGSPVRVEVFLSRAPMRPLTQGIFIHK